VTKISIRLSAGDKRVTCVDGHFSASVRAHGPTSSFRVICVRSSVEIGVGKKSGRVTQRHGQQI